MENSSLILECQTGIPNYGTMVRYLLTSVDAHHNVAACKVAAAAPRGTSSSATFERVLPRLGTTALAKVFASRTLVGGGGEAPAGSPSLVEAAWLSPTGF